MDVGYQEFDGDDGYDKCHDHPENKNHEFIGSEVEAEFDQLQKARTCHDRNAHKEGKLSSNSTRGADEHPPDDGRAGAGGPRDEREYLEAADFEGGHWGHVFKAVDGRLIVVFGFNPNKDNPINNESDGNDHIIIEVFVKPVVQRKPNDGCWETANQNHIPNFPSGFFFLRCLLW